MAEPCRHFVQPRPQSVDPGVFGGPLSPVLEPAVICMKTVDLALLRPETLFLGLDVDTDLHHVHSQITLMSTYVSGK
jgi:hypothetical protein